MKYLSVPLFPSTEVSSNVDSAVLDCNQLFKLSAQVNVEDGPMNGSCQFQVSNDISTPSNWSNLGSPVALGAVSSSLFTATDLCYRWLRASISNDGSPTNTITTVADVGGSLNDTLFYISTPSTEYYVWFNVDGGGTDPMIPGKTGVEVDLSQDDGAPIVAGNLGAALDALPGVFSTSIDSDVLTVQNLEAGDVAPAEDGVPPTGFSFEFTQGVGTMSINIFALSA